MLKKPPPKAKPRTESSGKHSNIRILRDPPLSDILQRQDWINHPADVPILVAAMLARVDYLATLNTRHFIDDPEVSHRSGLRIGTPGAALAWVREQWSKILK